MVFSAFLTSEYHFQRIYSHWSLLIGGHNFILATKVTTNIGQNLGNIKSRILVVTSTLQGKLYYDGSLQKVRAKHDNYHEPQYGADSDLIFIS